MAYNSDESGMPQVYVISFPSGDQKFQISTAGGLQPYWRRDGKELYDLTTDGKLMAVDLSAGFNKLGAPSELFDTGLTGDPLRDQYAVAPEGNRFLVLKSLVDSTPMPITVVLSGNTGIRTN